jgi:putative (di)nucleoside polyphosphate hydrolase
MARSRKTTARRAPCPGLNRLPSSPRRSKPAEPTLAMLLGEPEVRLLMRADNVDEREVIAMLDAVSAQLRRRSIVASQSAYRQGVGVMLLNPRYEIFVGRRADAQADAWQMPQGGIGRGEKPRQAALRELEEEIGTANVEILAESKTWFYYDVPEQLAQKAWRGRWTGQRQKWFVMLFKGDDAEINVGTDHPEFNAWRWVSVQELIEPAVSFKRQLYLNVLGEFATIFRD